MSGVALGVPAKDLLVETHDEERVGAQEKKEKAIA
jgi:hypothetical protein